MSETLTATSGYYTYTVTDGSATITDVDTSISGDITIPSTLGVYTVTSIGNEAFLGCTSLTSVTIPDSVTSIGGNAFGICTSLTSITIPDSVTSIGGNVFTSCPSLTSINVDVSNINYCDIDGVLFNKDKTNLIKYPIGNTRTSYAIPDSVTSIGSDAFSDCKSLTSITIPDSVISIDYRAFNGCESLTIYGYSGSYAETYASENSINFEALNLSWISCYLASIVNPMIKFDSRMVKNSVFDYDNIKNENENIDIDNEVIVYPMGYVKLNINIPKDTLCDDNTNYSGKTFYELVNDATKPLTDLSINVRVICPEPYGSIYYQTTIENISNSSISNERFDFGWFAVPTPLCCFNNMFSAYKLARAGVGGIVDIDCNSSNIYGNATNIGFNKEYYRVAWSDIDRDTLMTTTSPSKTSIYNSYGNVINSRMTSGVSALLKDGFSTRFDSYEAMKEVLKNYGNSTLIQILVKSPSLNNDTLFSCQFDLKGIGFGIGDINFVEYDSTICDPAHRVYLRREKAPTCTETGIDIYKCDDPYCNHYGEEYEVEIPATGHTIAYKYYIYQQMPNGSWMYSNYIAGTSTEINEDYYNNVSEDTCKYKKSYCSECREVINECYDEYHTEVIDKAVAPTCTETGLTEGKHCSVCNTVIVAQEVIPAKGHVSSDWQIVKNPTTTETGLKQKVCTVCNEVLETVILPKLDENHTHSYISEITTKPTCTEKGIKTYNCSCSDSYTEEISATGHTEVIDEAVAPTETETGLTEGKHCSVCGKVLLAQEVIPALGGSSGGGSSGGGSSGGGSYSSTDGRWEKLGCSDFETKANKKAIENNKSAIASNAEAIARNKSAIETNTANIEKLETDKADKTYVDSNIKQINDNQISMYMNGLFIDSVDDLTLGNLNYDTGKIQESTIRATFKNNHNYSKDFPLNISLGSDYYISRILWFNDDGIITNTGFTNGMLPKSSKANIIFGRNDQADIDINDLKSNLSITQKYINALQKDDKYKVRKVLGKNLFNPETKADGFLNRDGTLVSSSSYVTSDFIEVSAGKTYMISPKIRKALLFDTNKSPITSSYINDETINASITPTVDGFLKITVYTSDLSKVMVEEGSEATEYEEYAFRIEDGVGLSDTQKQQVKDLTNDKANKKQSNNLFVGHSWTYGKDISSSAGNKISSAYSSISDLIPIQPNTTYTINIFNSDYKRQLFAFYYTEDKIYISSIGRIQMSDLTTDEFRTFTTADNSEIAYIRFRWHATYGTEESLSFEKTLLSQGNIAIEPLNDYQFEDVELSDYQKDKINALPLANKRLVNFGDSIAAGVSGTSYSQQIASKNYMLLESKAKGGATIRVVDGNDNNVLNQINNYTPTIIPDFVLLEGLTNDAYTTVTEDDSAVGTISDGFTAELDTSTFCGAFETILKTAMIKYRGAKIIYITTHINKNRDYNAQKKLTDLAIQICEKWGVTIVDMFHEGGLNSFITEHFSVYINDGSHPNTLGYATFYVPMIESKMKALAN